MHLSIVWRDGRRRFATVVAVLGALMACASAVGAGGMGPTQWLPIPRADMQMWSASASTPHPAPTTTYGHVVPVVSTSGSTLPMAMATATVASAVRHQAR